MDAWRFDQLTRLLGDAADRRALLGSLLGVVLGGDITGVLAKRDKHGKGDKRKRKNRGDEDVQEEGRKGAARKKHHRRKQTQRRRRKQRDRRDRNKGGNLGSPGGCTADGQACTVSSDCCSENCFNFVCTEPVQFCGNDTCQPAALGCCAVEGCCQPPANQCNDAGDCCTPNCTGKACGPDGCGGNGACGSCADGFTCNEDSQCVCTLQPDGGSCSANGDCCSGNCCGGSCCDAGGSCCSGACCPPPNTKCCGFTCCEPNATCCGGSDGFGECCLEPLFGFCTGSQCVPCFPGCQQGQRCSATGECVCDATSCPDGCCSGGPGNPGTCEPKTPDQPCPCTPQNCPTGCCDGTVCHAPPSTQFCGTAGATCDTCTAQQQCIDGHCCTRECISGQCGPIQDGCGGMVECGQCGTGATPSCKDSVCASCPATCPNVRYCLNLTNGATVCCNGVNINCALGCSSDTDCDQGQVCMASFSYATETPQNLTVTMADECGVPAICTSC